MTYIYHSCFAIETEECTVIIDYYEDPGGCLAGILGRAKRVYVLASHAHHDHFNPEVIEITRGCGDVTYVFSDDISAEVPAVLLRKGLSYEDAFVKIQAFGSTDEGVSFMIEISGKSIFHAGDLNNWHWNEEVSEERAAGYEKKFLRELSHIGRVAKKFDVVMFPMEPRLGKDYELGAQQFKDMFDIGTFLPMHFGDKAFLKQGEEIII